MLRFEWQHSSAYVTGLWNITTNSSIRYSVLADSYVGVFPEDRRSVRAMMNYLGACDVDLKAPAAIVEACKAKTLTVMELMSALLKRISFSDWLFIISKFAAVQREYCQLMNVSLLSFLKSNSVMDGDDFFKVCAIICVCGSCKARVDGYA